MSGQVHHIWNPETGITEIEGDTENLAASEIPDIRALWKEYQDRLKGRNQLTEFAIRLNREWAIETGIIENLYDIDRSATQSLIENGFQSELLEHGSTNKNREWVIKIINDQKDAIDDVFDFVRSGRTLSSSYIKELHSTLVRNQDVTEGVDVAGRHITVELEKGIWKTQPNFPVRDGVTYRYAPPEHVASEIDRLIKLHDQYARDGAASEVRAAWLHHRFTQIHPFQDGNGRVARALASLVLMQDELFPLVLTRDEKKSYLEALEVADEGDLRMLVDIFVKQQVVQLKKASNAFGPLLSA